MRKIHISMDGAIGSVTTRNPTWCGLEHRPGLTTVDLTRATCERCIAAEKRFREDVDYHRTQERIQREEDSVPALVDNLIAEVRAGWGDEAVGRGSVLMLLFERIVARQLRQADLLNTLIAIDAELTSRGL